jgi:hypothetical protein
MDGSGCGVLLHITDLTMCTYIIYTVYITDLTMCSNIYIKVTAFLLVADFI